MPKACAYTHAISVFDVGSGESGEYVNQSVLLSFWPIKRCYSSHYVVRQVPV